jgi:hypothetical protein
MTASPFAEYYRCAEQFKNSAEELLKEADKPTDGWGGRYMNILLRYCTGGLVSRLRQHMNMCGMQAVMLLILLLKPALLHVHRGWFGTVC